MFEYSYFMSSSLSQMPQRDCLNGGEQYWSLHILQGPQSRGSMSLQCAECLCVVGLPHLWGDSND